MLSIKPSYKDFPSCKDFNGLVTKNKGIKSFTSSLNLTNNKMLEVDNFVRHNKKTVFGLAGITALTSFIISKLKLNKKNLPEHIDFQEAKTLKEAVDFGKKYLGIKSYKGFKEKDLEIVNWINQGLVNTSNAMGGQFKCPKKIAYEMFDDKKAIACIEGLVTLGINKGFIENIDMSIKSNLSKRSLEYFDKQQIAPLIENLGKFESGECMTLNEKISIFNYLDIVNKEIDKNPKELISEIIQDDGARNNLLKKGILQSDNSRVILDGTIVELTEQSLNNMHPYLLDIRAKSLLSESGYKFEIHKQSPFRFIYHELGHLQNNYAERSENTTGAQSLAQKLENWGYSKKDYRTALEISEYASISPDEFCAEVFAELMSGNKLSDEVMKLYAKYKGVIPKP